MIPLKQPTELFKQQLADMIKQQEDVSNFIQGYNIKGLNLSRAIISKFIRINENISNTLFIDAIIGTEGEITSFQGCNISGSNFTRCLFKGTTWFKNTKMQNANFHYSSVLNGHWEGADMRNCDWCGILTRFDSQHYLRSIMSEEGIQRFCGVWGYNAVLTRKEE